MCPSCGCGYICLSDEMSGCWTVVITENSSCNIKSVLSTSTVQLQDCFFSTFKAVTHGVKTERSHVSQFHATPAMRKKENVEDASKLKTIWNCSGWVRVGPHGFTSSKLYVFSLSSHIIVKISQPQFHYHCWNSLAMDHYIHRNKQSTQNPRPCLHSWLHPTHAGSVSHTNAR